MLSVEIFTGMISEIMEYELNSFFLNGVFQIQVEKGHPRNKVCKIQTYLILQKKYNCNSLNN